MAKLVAIDNGHGYNTAGKRTPKMPDGRVIREWEFNHPTAKKLEQVLKRCGLQTVMVSDTREDTPLATRVNRANNAKADVFVSIHYNAYQGKWGSHGGVEVHHYKTSNEGKKLAQLVQKELVKATGLRDRGIKTYNFYVTRRTAMPAVLCECGFMDNLGEAKLMLNEKHQEKVAEAIARGICSYLGVKYVPKAEPKPTPKPQPRPSGTLYRVIVDGKQVGAYGEIKNIVSQIERQIAKAKEIKIERV